MFRSPFRIALVFVFLAPVVAWAQGLLVVESAKHPARLPRPVVWHRHPRPMPPPTSYRIKDLDVQVRLVDQVAQVQVSQTFVNTGSRPMEVAFVFPLPYDGAIDRMTLMIDGKEFPAKLLDADEARRMYEEIVRRNRDPALLEWLGAGLFRTSVFPVPAGASRTVSLRYSQLCRKQDGLTDFLFPLSTAKYTSEAPERLNVRLTVESQEAIKNIYSPTHAIEIKRPDEHRATITWTSKKEVPASDFRLFYDVGRGKLGAKLLSYRPEAGKDGFFLLLASPKIKAADSSRQPKTVVLVMDRSGSMSGEKIEQARGALKHVLNNLRDGDLFNIIAYDSDLELFKPELQRYNDQTRKAALGFVEGLYAGGLTNIDAAMRTALGQLKDTKRPSYVVFLTDGLPTAGESNETKIVANAKRENKVRARVFAFGVGYDLNSRLLDKLVRANHGQSEFVKPGENIESAVAKLYNRIESPVMTEVRLDFVFDQLKTEEGKPVDRIYPAGSFDLFAGEQLVVVGRYRKAGPTKVAIEGMVGDRREKFEFPATLVEKSTDESLGFVEKLWAMRRVGDILDQIDLQGQKDELVKELVALATQHGILTPYTSFMADEGTNIHDLAGNAARAGKRLGALADTEGRSGVAQRKMKGNMSGADRFVRRIESSSYAARGIASGAALAPAEAKSIVKEMELSGKNMQQIGNRNFFRRDGRWVDSQVTKEQAAKAQRIKQFSDEYFRLAEKHGRRLSQYLVFDEPVLLDIDGETYLIEP